MNFLKNTWYLAAWSDEIAPGALMARTLLDTPVVLLRTADGRMSALHDRCPHRFAPLSLGRVTESGLQCGYHGLEFDLTGRCNANPHGPVAAALRVPAFPVHEAHKAIWIWFGDEAADVGRLPDLAFIDAAPPTAFSKGYLYSRGSYQLYIDNIMDLSHVDYLHPTTIGSGAITRTKPKIQEFPESVLIQWLARNESVGSLMESVLQLKGAPADVWTEVHWTAPTVMRLVHGGVRSGSPREAGANNVNLHVVTPETAASTHYFFAATRTYRVEDVAFNDEFATIRKRIFATEDKPMIEAQHDRMNGEDFWDLKPRLFAVDDGVARVRRKLEKMIAREALRGTVECPSPATSTSK